MSRPAARVPRAWLWGILGFALLVRLVYLTAVLGLHSPIPHRYDDGIYHDLGRSIAAGQGMSVGGHPTAIVSPGYPAFIAAGYGLFGVDPAGPRLMQAVLGAATAVLLSLLTLELGLGTLAAACAGVMAAVYPSSIYFTGRYFPMILHLFLLVLAIYGLVRWNRGGGWWPLLSAVALGLGALVRADLLMLIPILALAILLMRGWNRRALAAALALIVVGGALQLPWVMRNRARLGAPILTTTFAWRTLWVGNNPWARGGFALAPDVLARYATPGSDVDLRPDMRDQLAALRRWHERDLQLTEVEGESAFADMVTRWRREEPGRYAANIGRKLLAFASPWPGQGGDVLVRYRFVLALSFGVMLPLVVVGVASTWRMLPERWLFLAVLMQALVTALVVFGHPRFRFAAEMAFMPFAAYGLVRAVDALQGRRRAEPSRARV